MKKSLKKIFETIYSEKFLESAIFPKYYSDSTKATGTPRTRHYMQWIEDNMPNAASSDKSYYGEIENFKNFRDNWTAFNAKTYRLSGKNIEPVLYNLEDSGEINQTKIEEDTPLNLLEPINQITLRKNKELLKDVIKRKTVFVELKNGLKGYIEIDNISHNLSTKSTGKISNKILGYGVENSVYAAINDFNEEEALNFAINDSRNSEYINASNQEKERFSNVIKSAFNSVKNYINSPETPKFSNAEDPTIGSSTAAVDVPVKVNNEKAEIHVKYEDEERLFGLRKTDGAKSSVLFTNARNKVLKQFIPTLESYKNWIENYKLESDFNPNLVANLNIPEINSILSRFGTLEIERNWRPITLTTPVGDNKTFIDPRSLIRNMHRKNEFQSGIISLLQIYPDLLTREEFSGVVDELKKDVEKAIKSNEIKSPGGVFYFNFKKDGSLKVTNFSIPLDVSILINDTNKKSTDYSSSNRKSIGYIVKVEINNQELFPFHIQISSLARGKPLQVLKTKDFVKLINLIQDTSKEKTLKEVYSYLYSNKKVINEGGVGGHMLHPYEVLEGTPRDLINRIKQYGVSQKLIEKVDGQNLFFTVEKDGTPMFARNKQDMTHQDLIEKFTGHGAEKPFLEGGNAIVQGVQQWKNSGPEFFEQEVIEAFHPVEGQKSFINFEIMHPDKPNQIKYDKRYIVFHGIVDFEYGPKGREEVYRTNKGERLQKIIRQMKPGVQSAGFILASNRTVDMNALTNVQIAEYIEQIKQIADSIGITEDQDFATGVLNSIKQKLSDAEIETNKETLKKIEEFVLYGEDIEGNSIQGKDVKKLFSKEDAKKLTALGLTSATKASRIISDTLTQFAPIFVNLGIDLLSGVKSAYMSDDFNKKNIDELREKLQVAIDDYNEYVAATPDDKQSNVVKRLKRHVDVVKDTGLENIVNSAVEGGVYDENGDLLKVTGGFAPLNQIIGAAYRDNEGIFPTFIKKYRDVEKNESKKYSLKSVFNLID